MYSKASTKEQNILQDGKKSEEKYGFEENVAIMLFTSRVQ